VSSGGSVFQEALRFLRAQRLPVDAERHLVGVIEAARGSLPLFNEARFDAIGLDPVTALRRTAAVYLLFASGRLAETGGAAAGEVLAPNAQYVLHNLAIRSVLDSGVGLDLLADVATSLALAAAHGPLAGDSGPWTAERYQAVTTEAVGRQYGALLGALWAGTPASALAARAGHVIGCASAIANDAAQGEARFHGMPPADQLALLRWAATLLDDDASIELRSVGVVRRSIAPSLRAALGAVPPA
jgi:hypothetical protein